MLYMNIKMLKSYIISNFKKLSYKDLIIFLIPFIVFIAYLYVFDPGILRFDTYDQLNQIAKWEFFNWHPFFHTFIEMICIKIFPNPISISILQILTFSTMWMIICNYFRQDNIRKNFILQIIVTIIIALIPINAILSITLLKDTLFCYFMLFSCFLIKVLLDKKGDVGYIFLLILCLSMAFVAQLRPNGIYVILLFLVILAIYLYMTNKSNKLFITIPALTIVFILLIASLNVIYDVQDNEKDAMYTKTIHMLADYDLNLTLDSNDKAKIHEIINESEIKNNYRIAGSDKIYFASNQTPYDNDKFSYLGMAFKYSMQNPVHFIKYIFESSPMTWDIVKKDNWVGSAYSTNASQGYKNFYSERHNNTPAADFDNVTQKHEHEGYYLALADFVYSIKNNTITNTLFNSPALYMYLSIILLGLICYISKSKEIILIYLPNLFNIMSIFASTPIQDVRYLYSNFLIFYLLVIILIGILTKRKEPDYVINGYDEISQKELERQIREKILNEMEDENKKL